MTDQRDRSSGKFHATSWYLAGIVLGVPAPWVVFKRIRTVPLSVPLVSWCCAVALRLQRVLAFYSGGAGFATEVGLVAPGWMAWYLLKWSLVGLLTDVVILTACSAARRDSVRDTLRHGFLYGVLIDLSRQLWWEGPTRILSAVASRPSLAVGFYVFDFYRLFLAAYVRVAGGLAAARLADRLDHVDTSDPLWPRCIRCGYSLRGLPMAEEWLATGMKHAVAKQTAAFCPECGSAIVGSLREWQARLAARDLSRPIGPDRPDMSGLAKRLPCSRLKHIIDWVVTVSRFRATAAWLIALGTVAGVISVVHSPTSSSWPQYWVGTALRTILPLWTAGTAILIGLLLSRRSRRNLLWLAHHAAAPAIGVALPAAMLVPLIQWTFAAQPFYLPVVRTPTYLCIGLILLGWLICSRRASAVPAVWFAIIVALTASIIRVKPSLPPGYLPIRPEPTYHCVGLVALSVQVFLTWKAYKLLSHRGITMQSGPNVAQENKL